MIRKLHGHVACWCLVLAASVCGSRGQSPAIDPMAGELLRVWSEHHREAKNVRIEVEDAIDEVLDTCVEDVPEGCSKAAFGGKDYRICDGVYYQRVYNNDDVCYLVVEGF